MTADDDKIAKAAARVARLADEQKRLDARLRDALAAKRVEEREKFGKDAKLLGKGILAAGLTPQEIETIVGIFRRVKWSKWEESRLRACGWLPASTDAPQSPVVDQATTIAKPSE